MYHREEDDLSVAMFEEAFGIEAIPGHLHADNGAAMTSGVLQDLCGDLQVQMSHNRPSISNDNPFKEAEFRTMKHRPHYPGHFEDIDQEREWLDEYVLWFNNGHHHSALAWHTPQSVADGTLIQINKA